ncbi:outer membrane protein assembly factor BamB family protein [Parafrankia irregularis]|uniref:outer membrane protein assembly factor BamB family protein n=1 Tax=Parafrankia irregularis TaxID=795642 RepID=UPI001D005935|nr:MULTISPECIES: PQQ-binding-like beta-propeller repeat protein [Frankiaceae]
MRFAHITDTHVSAIDGDPSQAVELAARYGDQTDTTSGLRYALEAAADHGAAFAVITGDLTDHGTPEEFRRVLDSLAAAPLPVEIVPGNHDHYGHRHQPHPGDTPHGGGFLGAATLTRYEQAMGPRWWSADLGGVHLLALDWFSAWCGIDDTDQQRFVIADLATRAPGLPVVVLAHNQPDHDTLALIRCNAAPDGLLAVLSGHWHADAQRNVGGCHLLSTPAASFGGLDWSPPQLRLITLTSCLRTTDLRHNTIPALPKPPRSPTTSRVDAPTSPRTTSHSIGDHQHLGTLATLAGTVIAPSADTHGAGHLTRLHTSNTDGSDGSDGRVDVLWTMRVADEPVTGVLASHDQILACSHAGTLTALDPATGATHWTRHLPHWQQRRLLATPILTATGRLIVGDVGGITCLNIDTGDTVWHRDQLGQVDTLLTYGTGLATDRLAVLPLGGPTPGLTALNLRDGTLAWTDPPGTPPPSTSLVAIDGTDALLLRTAGPTLERLDLSTGQIRWRTTVTGRFSTAAPLVTDEAILLVTGDGIAHRLDPDHGDIFDRQHLHGLRPAYGPYRSTGTGAPTTPVHTPLGPMIVLLDGSIWQLGCPDGPLLVGDIASPVTTQPVSLGLNTLVVLSTDAVVHLLDINAPVTRPTLAGLASWQAS